MITYLYFFKFLRCTKFFTNYSLNCDFVCVRFKIWTCKFVCRLRDFSLLFFSATNGTSSPSRHFGSSFGSHRADYEPVGPGGGPTPAAASNGNGTRYPPNTTTGANQGGEMYDVPVGM